MENTYFILFIAFYSKVFAKIRKFRYAVDECFV